MKNEIRNFAKRKILLREGEWKWKERNEWKKF